MKVEDAWQSASLVPVIIVAKGNPKQITRLEDFARPGLRVGLTDTANTISGEIVNVMLTKAGIKDAVMKNVVKRTLQGRDLAAALIAGEVDVGIVWNAVVYTEQHKVDAIEIDPKWRPTGGEAVVTNAELGRLELDYVRVTIALLDQSKEPRASAAFAAYCASDEGAAVFAKYGFSPPNRDRPAVPRESIR